jgi:hypothetical protein
MPASLISSVNRQGRHIRARSPRHRPTWVPRISGIHLPKLDIRRTIAIRRPPRMAPAPTYTVLPLRSAAPTSQPSCRGRGPLRPTLCPGGHRRYTARGRVPRHPFLVEFRRTGIGPVPRRPSPALFLPRVLIRVLRRPFLEHPLLLTGSLATNTPMLSRGLPALAVARCWAGQSNRRRCCLHPMGSVVPRISRSHIHSSIP